jgi:hypothetical protein
MLSTTIRGPGPAGPVSPRTPHETPAPGYGAPGPHTLSRPPGSRANAHWRSTTPPDNKADRIAHVQQCISEAHAEASNARKAAGNFYAASFPSKHQPMSGPSNDWDMETDVRFADAETQSHWAVLTLLKRAAEMALEKAGLAVEEPIHGPYVQQAREHWLSHPEHHAAYEKDVRKALGAVGGYGEAVPLQADLLKDVKLLLAVKEGPREGGGFQVVTPDDRRTGPEPSVKRFKSGAGAAE